MRTAIVVGGGLAGVLSAILLKRTFERVVLIEKESRIGGLLNSYRNAEGYEFDCGTHVLSKTGIRELDAILFEGLNNEHWQTMDYAKAGHYFGGTLNEKSPNIDATRLPESLYQRGMIECLEAGERQRGHYPDLDAQLRGTFGNVFTDHLFKPALWKFVRHDLKELLPYTNCGFQLARITGLAPEITRQLKKIPVFDRKLAYHSNAEGISGSKKYYPRHRGIGLWMEMLRGILDKRGVEVYTNQAVSRVGCHGGRAEFVELGDGRRLDSDALIWTIPVTQCIRVCGWKPPQDLPKPSMLTTSLFHYVIDRSFLTDLHYITCFAADLTLFRVTLFSNLQGLAPGRKGYHLTVEVLSPEPPDPDELTPKIIEELKSMGVVPAAARVLFTKSQVLENGFPVMTSEAARNLRVLLDFVRSRVDNILLAGRSAGNAFSMHWVLVKTYHDVVRLTERANKSAESRCG